MCIFCKIIKKEIPADFLFENGDVVAFRDIHPKTKTHILIVPKKHIETIKDLKEDESDEILVGKMFLVARDIAKKLKLEGYQTLFNVGKLGGQEVMHIHLHLMSNY
jgi:histidine triad (HIT) family protein